MGVKLYFSEAAGIVFKTLPFLWVRLGSYALLGVALLCYFAAVGSVAWLLSFLWAPLGIITVIIGFGGAFGLVRLAMRYYFYMLNAAHAAVMTEYIVRGRAPKGGQIAHGKEQVLNRFRDTSVLFIVDRMIDGTVRAMIRSVTNVMSFLPIKGLKSLRKFMQQVAKYSSKYIDKAILSRAFKDDEENVWKVAQDGVILYAQCWKPILANAVVLTLLSYVEFFLFLAILGIPAAMLGALIGSTALNVALAIFVIVGAWMLKLALADAFAMASTLLVYHRTTEGMVPNPEWKARLEDVSDQFGKLRRKVNEAASSASPDSADSSINTEMAPATAR